MKGDGGLRRCILLSDGRCVGGYKDKMVVLSASGKYVACLEVSKWDDGVVMPYLDGEVRSLPRRWQGLIARVLAFRDAFAMTPAVLATDMEAWRPRPSKWLCDFKKREAWTSLVENKVATARQCGLGLIEWRHAWQGRKLVRYSGIRPTSFCGVPGVCCASDQNNETLEPNKEDAQELWSRFSTGGPLNLSSAWTAVYEFGSGLAFLDAQNRIQVRPGTIDTMGDARFALLSSDRGHSFRIAALGCHGDWESWSSSLTLTSALEIAQALKPSISKKHALALAHLALALAARTKPESRLLCAPVTNTIQQQISASFFLQQGQSRQALASFQCDACLMSLTYTGPSLKIISWSLLQSDGLFLSSSSMLAIPPKFRQHMTHLDSWARTWGSLDMNAQRQLLQSRATALAQARSALIQSQRFLQYSSMLSTT